MAVSQMSVRYKVPSISELDNLFLPAVILNGIQWKINLIKSEEVNSLAVFMHCANNDETDDDWSFTAKCSIKLISFEDSSVKEECYFLPMVFDSTITNWGTECLIDWNELFDEKSGLLENDSINLEICIEAIDPNDPGKSRLTFENVYQSCEENCCAIFRLIIKNVDRLMAVKTPRFNEECMPWTLTIFKDSDALMARLDSNGSISKKAVCIQLIQSVYGMNGNVGIKCFQPSGSFQTKKLIPWTELLKPQNGYIKNNSICIGVKITADGLNQLMDESKPTVRLECAICLENIQDYNISSVACGHLFCTACIEPYVRDHGACPSCQKPAVKNDLRRMYLPITN